MIRICVWTFDMTSRNYFGKMNLTLGSVVPLAMFLREAVSARASFKALNPFLQDWSNPASVVTVPSTIVHRTRYNTIIRSVNEDFPLPAGCLFAWDCQLNNFPFSVYNTFNQHKCLHIEKVTAFTLSLLESQASCAKCVHSFLGRNATFEWTSPSGKNHSYSSSCPICCRLGLKSDGWM